ncbi:MAG: gas vesicle protein GvpJ [Roseiarcus sp.]|jgi:hypothetical protein
MQTMIETDCSPLDSARSPRGDLSLADALDRVLHRGVALHGDLTIGLADVELVFLDLRLLLGSVDTIWPDGRPVVPALRPRIPPPLASPEPPSASVEPESREVAFAGAGGGAPIAVAERQGAEGSSTAKGLIRLVLTLVKLLHDVLERQAVRRMEAGRLTDVQIDNLGTALFAQAEEILRLQRQFGFSEKDLSLDLSVPDGAF